jgi:hypothetical protein
MIDTIKKSGFESKIIFIATPVGELIFCNDNRKLELIIKRSHYEKLLNKVMEIIGWRWRYGMGKR